ncbi:MAG: hypothetical protein E6K83_01025 [Thaumarchaeota archaeon]|nr:MAG: hypothetical protein E6K83_01025 [Nitrososphaerota archaeon]
MTSLAAIAKSYKTKKAEVTKLRRKGQNKLKEVLSQKRRSSSGLASLERKKEATARQRDHVIQLLTQSLAQRESLARLKTAAEERLRQEQDAKDQTKQQSEYGGPEEKAASVERLKLIDYKISELRAQIRERELAEARLVSTIENYEKEKAQLDKKLRKQIHEKPSLVEQLKTSTKAEATLRPRVQSLVKREAQAGKTLVVMQRKLALVQKRIAQLAAKRRKAKRKAKRKVRKAKRKIAKRRIKTRIRKAAKRKRAIKRKAKTRTRKLRKRVRKARRKKSKSRRRK